MSRNWYDGNGANKRLRVKGIVDLPPPVKPERSPDSPDPGHVAEVHKEARKAINDEDDHKVGKIFEDLLDDIHKSPSRAHEKIPVTLTEKLKVFCPELESAIQSELRELGRADSRWGWAFKLTDDGLHILARDPDNEGWQCLADAKAISQAIRECKGDARGVAGVLVGRARREIFDSRTRWHLGGHIPVGALA